MRPTLRSLALAACLVALPSLAGATDLLQAWQAAQQHDRELAVARAELQRAQPQRAQAAALWRPGVALTLAAGLGNSESEMRGAQFSAPGMGTQRGVDFATSVTGSTATRWQLQASQPLYNPQRRAQQQQLQLQADMTELQWHARQQQVMLRTAERYLGLALAQETLRVTQQQLAAVQQAFDAAQERYRLGSAPITDTHEAQARLAALQAQQWAAQAQLDIQRRALADSTGLAPAQLHAHLPQASQAAPGTDTNNTPASLLLWQERAAQSNPGLLLQQRAVELAQAEADKHQRSSAASVDLVAQAGQERLHGSGSYGDAQNKQLNAMVGLQLTVPLSTGGWRSAKLEDSLRQHEAAQATLEQQREQVAQQVHSAWLGLHLGGERVRALHTALTASSARLDATRTGHEVGDRSLLDVLNAHADQATQQLALAQARSELLLNQLRLAQLAGSLDEDALRQANHSLQATDFATK